jgi:hypothetical protein
MGLALPAGKARCSRTGPFCIGRAVLTLSAVLVTLVVLGVAVGACRGGTGGSLVGRGGPPAGVCVLGGLAVELLVLAAA